MIRIEIENVMMGPALLLLVVSWTPFVLVLALSLWKGKRLAIPPKPLTRWPSVSIMIPTCNEESTIVGKLEEVLGLDYPTNKCDIVVVDESTDKTRELVEEMRRKYPNRISIIHHDFRLGLANALHNGYSASNRDVIVKTDCDATILEENALKLAISYLLDSQVGAVSGVYTSDSKRERIYRRMLQSWQTAQANIFSTVIAHGCFVAFKRELYTPLSPTSRADDTEIFVDMMRKGYRTLVIPEILCVEQRPLGRWDSIMQRSRRAEGILRLILGTKGRSLAERSIRGLLLTGLDLYLIGVSPFVLLAFASILMMQLTVFGWLGYSMAIVTAMILMVLWLDGRNVIASFLDTQLAGALGLLSTARRPSGIYPRI